jgi:deoxyxylulose-5-phosphate synthase
VDAAKRGAKVRVVGLPEILPSEWLGLDANLDQAAKQDGLGAAFVDALSESGAKVRVDAQDMFVDLDDYVEEVGIGQATLENLAGENIDKTFEYLKLYDKW